MLKDATGKEVGKAAFTATPSGALLDLNLTAAQPGVHALHIHAVGKCEPPDFKSAGPHFNPDQTKHGIMNPEGPHAGDLPNIHVPADGKLEVELLNPVGDVEPGNRRCSTPTAPPSSSMPAPTTTRPTPPAIRATASPAALSPNRPSGHLPANRSGTPDHVWA